MTKTMIKDKQNMNKLNSINQSKNKNLKNANVVQPKNVTNYNKNKIKGLKENTKIFKLVNHMMNIIIKAIMTKIQN